ncbi:MAG: LuxR C-terminal-related transcriptional regulator [Mycobacteriales bacterium]
MTRRVQDAARVRERRVVRVRPSGFVPSEARLQRPRLRDGLVIRGELVDTVREQSDFPVVLVTGPPGYGKTTLLAQWDDEDERPFAWVSLDPAANDPTVLVTYVILALQRLGDADAGVVGALAEQSAVPTVLLPRLGRMLARQEDPFVLVLDDAECLTSPEALDVLTMVVKHLNEGSQLAVAARTTPNLPWSQLRSERRLLTLGSADLRLSAAEARAVLSATGVDLAPEELVALLERTEGWPAGIYLAALSLRQAARSHDVLTNLGGRGSVVSDYLRDELLAGLPPERRQFLIRTSVLTRMCGPLCDAVLGTTGAGHVLLELERSSLFVVPLEGDEEWYRYHHVFGAMLRDELSREEPAVVAHLHSEASRWLEAAGYVEEAVLHAQAAHEVDRAARLVWSQVGPYLATGRVATLQRWLEGFTSEQVVGHTKLALAAAWCALESGRPVDHWIAAAERGVFDASRPGERRSIAAAIALLHAQRARGGLEQMRADAQRALELQEPEDPWLAFGQYLQGVAVLLGGATEEARETLEGAGRVAEALRMPSHQALCLAQLACLALAAGDWETAGDRARTASALLVDNEVPDAPTVSLVHCVETLALARQGRTDEARRLARRAMRMIAVLNQCPPWMAVQTRYLLGKAHLLMGDTAAARVLLSEAQTHMRATPDATWLRDRLDEAWTHVATYPLATGVGPSALTSAEMRVLQLLPSHLSFEQIAKRLFLSRNTVKTQAIAAYRKLGVASRTEAVERARSLGMV